MNDIYGRLRVLKLLVVYFSLAGFGQLFAQNDRPNFVVIIVDDQGWNGLSVQMDKNNPQSRSYVYQTPNISTIAEQGIRFSRAYAPSSVCGPSRCSLFTGKSTARTGFFTNKKKEQKNRYLITPAGKWLNSEDMTTAEHLAGAGYATAHFGKWHIDPEGDAYPSPEYGPEAHGFQVSDGNNGNHQGNDNIKDDPKRTFSLVQKGIDFINEQNDEKPFYLHMSYYAVHGKPECTPKKLKLYNSGQRSMNQIHFNERMGAMTEDLDDGVGILLDALKEKGLMENTYILYTSDNGFNNAYAFNTPLRGEKRSLYEGGNRVPFLICGPGISANSQSDIPVCLYDILPTLTKLSGTGHTLPNDIDGQDLSAVLLGKKADFNPERNLYFYFGQYEDKLIQYAHKKGVEPDVSDTIQPSGYLISGKWKYMYNMHSNRRLLFDLDEDMGEENSKTGEYGIKVQQLHQSLEDYYEAVNLKYPTLNPKYKKQKNEEK